MAKEKVKHKYIFPSPMAAAMSKVELRTQLEASMLSMAFMSIGLIVSVFYAMFYLTLPLWFKISIVINAFFGIIFFSSYIITTYQSYLAHMEVVEYQRGNKK